MKKKKVKKRKVKIQRHLQAKDSLEIRSCKPAQGAPTSLHREVKRSHLGQLALSRKFITEQDLASALAKQQGKGDAYAPLGKLLVEQGVLSKAQLILLLKEQERLRRALRYYPPQLRSEEDALLMGNILTGREISNRAIQHARHIQASMRKINIDRSIFEILYDRNYIDRQRMQLFLQLAKGEEGGEQAPVMVEDDTTTDIISPPNVQGMETTLMQVDDILLEDAPEEGAIRTKEDLYKCLMSVTQEVPPPYPDNFFAGLLIHHQHISMRDMAKVRAGQGELQRVGVRAGLAEFMVSAGFLDDKKCAEIEKMLLAVGGLVPHRGPLFKRKFDEEWVVKLLLSTGILTVEQMEEVEKAQRVLEAINFPLSTVEIIVRQGLLGKRQIELLLSLREEGKLSNFMP